MKRGFPWLVLAVLAAPWAAAQQPDVPAMGFAQTQAQGQSEDELYRAGTDFMNEGKWQAAFDSFSQAAKMSGRKADGALYWKAYAQNKLGQRAAALGTIGELTRQYPKSTWLKDARVLEVEIRGESGQTVTPRAEDDEELKVYALNSLMNTDEERAIPMLEKVLNSNNSTRLKERALFVLAQSDSPRAQELVGKIARGQIQPELQRKAIHNLGINGNSTNKKALGEIYASSASVEAKKAVLQALGIGGGKEQLAVIARNEKSPDLRKSAIQGLAIAGAKEELRQLYKEATDNGTKSDLIHSSIVSGDSQLLMNVLQTEQDPGLKRDAIHALGISGGSGVSATLVNLYTTDKDRGIKDAAAQALFLHGDAHSLVELAKKETDPELRKMLVQKLSIMGNKEATDYLIQLLER
jgi:HEAT repeat protein